MAVENESTRIYLEKVEEPAFAHGIQAAPTGVKLKKSDWCQTNPSQKAFCLLHRKGGVYEAAIGDAAGLHTFVPPLIAQSFPYCFSADGLRLLLVHERDLLEVDLLSHELSKLHSTRRQGTLVAGYVGDGVYLLAGRSLSYYKKRGEQDECPIDEKTGSSLEELWRHELAMDVASVFDTGGPVLGFVPKKGSKKKVSMVFVRLDETGFCQLGRLAGLELVATWFHRPQGGALRTFARDGWYDEFCSWYELHNLEADAPTQRDAVLMDPKQLEALPKLALARAPRQKSEPLSAAQRAIRKLDELSYTKLINLYSQHFGALDLSADSPIVEQFSWSAAPWKGIVQSFDADGALVLLAKYMTYMYFNYPHSLLRLWHRAANEHPHDELVARLCIKVLLEGHFQPDGCIALMEPALARGEWDWCALARDTVAKPTADAAERLVAWAAPRRVAGLTAYLEPHLKSFPEWALQRIQPALEQLARPGDAHEACPSSALAQRAQLEATLRSAQSATARISAFQALAAIGEQAGLVGDVLEETRLDWLGFDPDGNRAFQYGEHTLVLHLGEDLGLAFQLGTETLSKRPPKGEKDGTAEAELSALRKALQEQRRAAGKRWERALLTSRSWPAWLFRVSFLDHPVMLRLARALVFERVHREERKTSFFTVNLDTSLVDEQGSFVTLEQEDTLRLAHPLRMSLEQREHFSRILAERPIAPLVAQLERITYRAEHEPLERVFEGVAPLNALALLKRLREHGFVRGELDEEHGEVYANHELALGGGLSLLLWHTLLPRSAKALARDERARLLRAEFVRNNELVEPARVEPVVYSELLTRLRQIAPPAQAT